jgi:hypothetical protein
MVVLFCPGHRGLICGPATVTGGLYQPRSPSCHHVLVAHLLGRSPCLLLTMLHDSQYLSCDCPARPFMNPPAAAPRRARISRRARAGATNSTASTVDATAAAAAAQPAGAVDSIAVAAATPEVTGEVAAAGVAAPAAAGAEGMQMAEQIPVADNAAAVVPEAGAVVADPAAAAVAP